jgi:hypothetical protein
MKNLFLLSLIILMTSFGAHATKDKSKVTFYTSSSTVKGECQDKEDSVYERHLKIEVYEYPNVYTLQCSPSKQNNKYFIWNITNKYQSLFNPDKFNIAHKTCRDSFGHNYKIGSKMKEKINGIEFTYTCKKLDDKILYWETTIND